MNNSASLQRPTISAPSTARAFVYRHVVSFEETNIVGNVYFTRHISWQGRCREMFLKQHAPDLLADIGRNLRLVTLRAQCDYFAELSAFDEINVMMRLAYIRRHRLGLDFEIVKPGPEVHAIAASGFQELACMRLLNGNLLPIDPPEALVEALWAFAGPSQVAGLRSTRMPGSP